MSTPKHTFEFTVAEAQQILSYFNHRDEGSDCGWYYGNREQFEARHLRVQAELETRLRDIGSAKRLP